jgi:hypothetical protein
VTSIAPWELASVPATPRKPSVILFVFGIGPLRDGVDMSLARFGAPSLAAVESCSVRTVTRAMDPRWFDAWRSGSLRTIAEQDLGPALATLDAADHVHVIACEPAAAKDLTYLQGAWALARYLIERGGTIVLDAHAMMYRAADKLQPAGEPLDVRHEVRVIFETDSTRADHAHALHTRGLKKFGAPDLVALCTDADIELVGQAISELAEQVARGTDLATPKHALQIASDVRWVAVADEHGLADLLQLNNEARVLVDENGHDLVGIVRRLQRN